VPPNMTPPPTGFKPALGGSAGRSGYFFVMLARLRASLRNATSGLIYSVLYTTDLSNWNQDVGATQAAGVIGGTGNQAVVVTLSNT